MNGRGRYVATTQAEKLAETILRRFGRVLIVGVIVAAIGVPIAHSYDAPTCGPAGFPEKIRNQEVSAANLPQCVDGVWTVTTPRDVMQEDWYGWNCFRDGNGVCGPLEPAGDSCLVDKSDNYTMCPDGRVWYQGAGTTKLYPVDREPS